MHMQEDLSLPVREFISENFLFREDLAGLDDDASLMEAGIVDSTGVMELIAFLESSFGIEVADEEMLPENLDSINAIAGYVRRKKGLAHAR